MSIVYITIGNSDDKLTQMEYGLFWADVNSTIHDAVYPDYSEQGEIHGIWSSPSTAQWQNACWCIEIDKTLIPELKEKLSRYAKEYKQDSIAFAIAETEFITP